MPRNARLAVVLALMAAASPALADDGRYCARLGPQDHVSSSGRRLTTPGAIIQQDRANFHLFGRRDREDQSDPIFHERVSRDALGARINGNTLSPEDRDEIVHGAPYVCVTIEGDDAFIFSVR